MTHVETVGTDFCQFRTMTMSPRIARARHEEERPLHCSLCGVEYVGGEATFLLINNFRLFDNCWCCQSCVHAIGFAQTVADLTELHRLNKRLEEMAPRERLATLRGVLADG